MAVIISTSINLQKIPKDKIVKGKKGQYLNVSVVLNDTEDDYGNHGPVYVNQTQEEREQKAAKVYLGNAKLVWTDGKLPGTAKQSAAVKQEEEEAEDLPF